jgi:hypothetical protein
MTVARTLGSFEEERSSYVRRMFYHIKCAAELGSSMAKYLLWLYKYSDKVIG